MSTQQIIFMRHAKSDWHYDVDDKQRPLNKRGTADARLMGKALHEQGYQPDYVISSSSQRTRETLKGMNNIWQLPADNIVYDDELYLASAHTLLELAEVYLASHRRLLVLGHNPGMDEIVYALSEGKISYTAKGKLMITAAAAVFDVDRSSTQPFKLKTLLRPGVEVERTDT